MKENQKLIFSIERLSEGLEVFGALVAVNGISAMQLFPKANAETYLSEAAKKIEAAVGEINRAIDVINNDTAA